MAKYFGTDGIRGRVGLELTTSLAFKVGQSIKDVLKADTLVIGCDTRESSYDFMYSVASGAQSLGINVILAGVVPTPVIQYYSEVKKIYGVMITASHNPYHDNGIKVFKYGTKLSEEEELAVEYFVDNRGEFDVISVGKVITSDEPLNIYKEIYKDLNLKKSNYVVAIDSAHGANSVIAKEMLSGYVKELHQIGANPDGVNINNGVGSTHLESIISLVKEKNADFGFSYDGDGDRFLLVDNDGDIIDGDKIIYIIASYLKSQNKLNKDTVVLTKMSNLGIIKAFNDLGIKVVKTDVGDKHVLAQIKEFDYSIGGENSGHIILFDHLSTGDGLFVSMYILKVLEETNKTLKELISPINMYPQKMENIKAYNKDIVNDQRITDLVTKTQALWSDDGKVLVRASGTEPLIRVTLSYKDEKELDKVMSEFISLFKTLKEE
ncbi:phosphoglucosamine mutase [Candidatus Izimaplasma sp. ZiA1]|uniref:phosphoglucosamine mutase n=1 Tax=Candidatus Izimoplasma sp. ZiA1 TaxID=2024899 RepID=UPI001438A064